MKLHKSFLLFLCLLPFFSAYSVSIKNGDCDDLGQFIQEQNEKEQREAEAQRKKEVMDLQKEISKINSDIASKYQDIRHSKTLSECLASLEEDIAQKLRDLKQVNKSFSDTGNAALQLCEDAEKLVKNPKESDDREKLGRQIAFDKLCSEIDMLKGKLAGQEKTRNSIKKTIKRLVSDKKRLSEKLKEINPLKLSMLIELLKLDKVALEMRLHILTSN